MQALGLWSRQHTFRQPLMPAPRLTSLPARKEVTSTYRQSPVPLTITLTWGAGQRGVWGTASQVADGATSRRGPAELIKSDQAGM